MIVADTGPLIAFARLERLDLLRQVVGELLIPEAVYEEMTRVRGRPGAADVERRDWIRQRVVRNQAAIATLPLMLHRGERQAIVLAEELEARLLIDERRGRALAAGRGLVVIGSLWVLAEAKRHGMIVRATPLVDALLAAGYWIDEDLVLPFLQEIGEANA
jgi:predicted nucleic acid-binding protein